MYLTMHWTNFIYGYMALDWYWIFTKNLTMNAGNVEQFAATVTLRVLHRYYFDSPFGFILIMTCYSKLDSKMPSVL